MKIFTMVRCKKDLYKSTYNGFAFEEGKYYKFISEEKVKTQRSEDDILIFIKDKMGHDFNFSKEVTPGWATGNPFYWVGDYFE